MNAGFTRKFSLFVMDDRSLEKCRKKWARWRPWNIVTSFRMRSCKFITCVHHMYFQRARPCYRVVTARRAVDQCCTYTIKMVLPGAIELCACWWIKHNYSELTDEKKLCVWTCVSVLLYCTWQTLWLFKLVKPKFLPGTRIDHWGVVNEWANLTCAVTAEPRAQFEWRQRERRLQSSDTVIIHNEENVSILQVCSHSLIPSAHVVLAL